MEVVRVVVEDTEVVTVIEEVEDMVIEAQVTKVVVEEVTIVEVMEVEDMGMATNAVGIVPAQAVVVQVVVMIAGTNPLYSLIFTCIFFLHNKTTKIFYNINILSFCHCSDL